MPSTYTVNLGIEKPNTGEQSGTWGDTVNDNSNILDEAINGVVSITLTSAGSSGSPNQIAITNGASSTGRNKWIEFADGGDLGAPAYVELIPNDAEKICFIRNSLAGSRSVFLFQGTYNASNDLEIVAGTDVVVKFNGGGTGATVVNANANLAVDALVTPSLVATTADINGGTLDGSVIGGSTAAAVTGTTVVANTSLNIAADGATVTGIKDENDMSSNSATKLATQQSIKAYVDAQVGTVDTLSEVLAIGNTSGATDINMDTTQKVQFRDSAIYINSSVDGQLDIVADTEIQIAATTIDINGAINASGEIIAASIDISGNIDVDGITNLDVVDIDGAVTVGVDDTGHDVKFFGATTGKSMLWDESADSLIVTGTVDATTVEFDSLSGTGAVAITDIKDEDNMASNSATALATQQSIKAYVDAQVPPADTLSEVLAIGNTSGSTDINMDTTQKVQFRDAAIYINSSVDGQLDIVADTEIQIAATTIDINGAINASGEIIAASLDISGNIDVDGITNLDVLDVDGAANFAADVTFAIGADIITATAGSGNFRAGSNAGNAFASSGNYNTVVGDGAGAAVTYGDYNTALGYNALTANTLGQYNTALGYNVLLNTTGSRNTATGYQALKTNSSGGNNVAVGYETLLANTTGFNQVAVGNYALYDSIEGTFNTAVGKDALSYSTAGDSNTAMGANALFTASTSSNNTALGRDALYLNTTGTKNIGLGYGAGDAIVTGSNNTIIGDLAGTSAMADTVLIGAGTTERMRIDSSGNVLIGTAVSGASGLNLSNDKNISIVEGTDSSLVNIFRQSSSGASVLASGYKRSGTSDKMASSYASAWAKSAVSVGYGNIKFYTDAATTSAVGTDLTPTERMRIKSSGEVLVGTTAVIGGLENTNTGMSVSGTGATALSIASSQSNLTFAKVGAVGSGQFTNFAYNGGTIGHIGHTATTTSYNTSSDYRLKTNVLPMTGATATFKLLKPVNFEWIADGTRVDGFLAHELQEVIPAAATGSKDAMMDEEYEVTAATETETAVMGTRSVPNMQGIDQSKVVPLLVATLQEALAEIEVLKERLTALE